MDNLKWNVDDAKVRAQNEKVENKFKMIISYHEDGEDH